MHLLVNIEIVFLESTTRPLACDPMCTHVYHLDLVPEFAALRAVLNLFANIYVDVIKFVVKRAL